VKIQRLIQKLNKKFGQYGNIEVYLNEGRWHESKIKVISKIFYSLSMMRKGQKGQKGIVIEMDRR
jgi:hypothetical protein